MKKQKIVLSDQVGRKFIFADGKLKELKDEEKETFEIRDLKWLIKTLLNYSLAAIFIIASLSFYDSARHAGWSTWSEFTASAMGYLGLILSFSIGVWLAFRKEEG